MPSIFNPFDNAALIDRINLLNSKTEPQWGKMSADQMIVHCNNAINVAFGKQDLKINFLMRWLGILMKNKVLNNDFQKNSPTAKEFRISSHTDFDTCKNELVKNVTYFTQGHSAIKVMDHPFWGKMTYEDWDKLMWKHLDHHLRQFGV